MTLYPAHAGSNLLTRQRWGGFFVSENKGLSSAFNCQYSDF